MNAARGRLGERGISRYQYFLAVARLPGVVLGTSSSLGYSPCWDYFFLHEDLSLTGSLVALITIIAAGHGHNLWRHRQCHLQQQSWESHFWIGYGLAYADPSAGKLLDTGNHLENLYVLRGKLRHPSTGGSSQGGQLMPGGARGSRLLLSPRCVRSGRSTAQKNPGLVARCFAED